MWGWIKPLMDSILEIFFKRIDEPDKAIEASASGEEEGLQEGINDHLKDLRDQRKSEQLE